MDDLISRQAAIDALCKGLPGGCGRAEYLIEQLPTAQPHRMRGRWIEITASDCSGYDPVLAGYDDPVVGYVCSTCHEGYEKEVMGKATWKYCPNCGSFNGGE